MHIIARMNVGGPAVEIAELMRGIDEQVISQRLVTGYCGPDEADFLETQARDIQATRIGGLGRSVRPLDDSLVLSRLITLIRASRPDVVHTHTAKAGVIGRIAAKASGTGTKIIHTHHGHLLHGYFGTAKTRAVIQLERQLSRITDRIITVGDKVRDDLLVAGIGQPDQYTVIRSGVRLGSLPDKRTARCELGLPDGPVIVSMIGRLTRIKRPDRFAEVVRMVSDKGFNVHFLVVGGGDEESHLRARVERENLPVTMLGWRNDLERILAATDIVLLTSDNEGTPLSLMEAGLAGLPTVATRVGAVSEVVQDGLTGVLSAPDVTAIAVAVTELVDNPDRARALGAAARESALTRFTVESFVSAHAGQYAEVAGLACRVR